MITVFASFHLYVSVIFHNNSFNNNTNFGHDFILIGRKSNSFDNVCNCFNTAEEIRMFLIRLLYVRYPASPLAKLAILKTGLMRSA